VLVQLEDDYPEDLRVIYRHFPLTSIHDKAALSAQAAEAAGIQDKFWEMHDLLYEKLNEWKGMSVEEFQEWLVTQADDLELDSDQFNEDLTSEDLVNMAQKAWEESSSIGIPGTPFLLINGQPYSGSLDPASLTILIEATLMEKQQYEDCPPMTIDQTKEYVATIETEKGDITIELYAEEAPLAVNSFVFLAQDGWYDNVTFHRVVPGFVAQAGDPSGTGMGGPGYVFDNEVSSDLKFDQPGVLGMANSGPGTNGSQFFITHTSVPNLDGSYTIFGRVISGMDVVESLTPRDPSQSSDLPPGDMILSIKIEKS
jgi:cyclophilin family peptidyl-prolyl cis-trans isomerase